MDAMDCGLARNLLTEYQDGALDAAAAAALAAHLRGCGECSDCAGSLLAVREVLRGLPPDPAPPELLPRILEAVEGEDRDVRADPRPGGADATRPFLSRFRLPLEAAAVVLLFAGVYWYQRSPATVVRPPSAPTAQAPDAAPPFDISPEASYSGAKLPHPAVRLPRGNPKTAKKEEAAAPAKPRTWTAADRRRRRRFLRARTPSGSCRSPPSPGRRPIPRGREPRRSARGGVPKRKTARIPACRGPSPRPRPVSSAPCRTDGTSWWS